MKCVLLSVMVASQILIYYKNIAALPAIRGESRGRLWNLQFFAKQ